MKITLPEEGNGQWRTTDFTIDTPDTNTTENLFYGSFKELFKLQISQAAAISGFTDYVNMLHRNIEQSTSESLYIVPEEVVAAQKVIPKMLPRIIRAMSYIILGGAIGLSVFNFNAFLNIPHFIIITIVASILTIWVTYLDPFRNI